MNSIEILNSMHFVNNHKKVRYYDIMGNFNNFTCIKLCTENLKSDREVNFMTLKTNMNSMEILNSTHFVNKS